MKLICKSCSKTIKISSIPGAELLSITSILGHIMTCKETQVAANERGNDLKEFMKIFFEIDTEK